MAKIVDNLPVGEENAISAENLARLLGFSSKRELQKAIARERNGGAIICSSNSGGYFRPQSKEEIRHFYISTRAKALSTLTILRSARMALNETDGQQELLDGR